MKPGQLFFGTSGWIYIYYNNDVQGHAISNANDLLKVFDAISKQIRL